MLWGALGFDLRNNKIGTVGSKAKHIYIKFISTFLIRNTVEREDKNKENKSEMFTVFILFLFFFIYCNRLIKIKKK